MRVSIVVDPRREFNHINLGNRTMSFDCHGHPYNNKVLARELRRYADFLEEQPKACQFDEEE